MGAFGGFVPEDDLGGVADGLAGAEIAEAVLGESGEEVRDGGEVGDVFQGFAGEARLGCGRAGAWVVECGLEQVGPEDLSVVDQSVSRWGNRPPPRVV